MTTPGPAALDDAITALEQAVQSATTTVRDLATQCAEARSKIRELMLRADSIDRGLSHIGDQILGVSGHLDLQHSPAREEGEGTP